MPNTALIAALFGLIFVYLSIKVIRFRLKNQISLGVTEGDAAMEQTVRAHANFAEYVPLCLILLGFVELYAGGRVLALILGTLLLVGRIAHVVGMLKPELFRLRQVGMVLTFLVILVSSLYLIWSYF